MASLRATELVSATQTKFHKCLHQFLLLEKSLQVTHLPSTGQQQNNNLNDGPPQNATVGAFAGLSESLFTVTLIVLFLADLFNLVQQLTNTQLQKRKLSNFLQFQWFCNNLIV